MLKFSGKAKCFKDYMNNLIELYGSKTTIKEVCQMIGGMKDVNL